MLSGLGAGGDQQFRQIVSFRSTAASPGVALSALADAGSSVRVG
jgi:hypothetical protein